MTESKKSKIAKLIPDGRLEKIKLLLSLLLSLLLIATAICFIVSCISIYKSGTGTPYSRAVVEEHLKKIAPVSFITVAFLIASGIISLFTKESKIKNIPIKKCTLLSIMKRKLDTFSASEKYLALVKEEKKRRQAVILSALALSAIFTAVALIFVLNPSRYSLDDINTDIAYSVVIASISTLLIFAICFVTSYFLDSSYSREIEHTKEELKSHKMSGGSTASEHGELGAPSIREVRTVMTVRIVVAVIAVIFITAGVLNGGMADVLGKAVRICTDCIGLG
jgi:hypothetical protein